MATLFGLSKLLTEFALQVKKKAAQQTKKKLLTPRTMGAFRGGEEQLSTSRLAGVRKIIESNVPDTNKIVKSIISPGTGGFQKRGGISQAREQISLGRKQLSGEEKYPDFREPLAQVFGIGKKRSSAIMDIFRPKPMSKISIPSDLPEKEKKAAKQLRAQAIIARKDAATYQKKYKINELISGLHSLFEPGTKETGAKGVGGIPFKVPEKEKAKVDRYTIYRNKLAKAERLEDAYRNFVERPKGGVAQVETGLKGVSEAIEEPSRIAPFLSSIKSSDEKKRVMRIIDKTRKGKALNAVEVAQLGAYRALQEEEASKAYQGPARGIGEMMPQMIKYGAEVSALGGAEPVKITSIAAGAKELILGAVQGLKNVPMIDEKAASLVADFNYRELKPQILKAEKALDRNKMNWSEAYKRAVGYTMAEYSMERLGTVIAQPLAFVKKATIGKFLAKRGIQLVTPQVTRFLRRMGWNGILSEILEEEATELLQAPAEKRKYAAPWTPEGKARLLTEALGIGIFGTLMNIPNSRIMRGGKVVNDWTAETQPGALSIKDINEGKQIPKELEPLAKEARKYKSAEEFVKKEILEKEFPLERLGNTPTKGIALHGTNVPEKVLKEGFKPSEGTFGRGIYLDPLGDRAVQTYGGKSGKNILAVEYNFKNPYIVKEVGEKVPSLETLKGQGYDGIVFQNRTGMGRGTDEIIAFDVSTINPSQLTDIWKRATKQQLPPQKPPITQRPITKLKEGGLSVEEQIKTASEYIKNLPQKSRNIAQIRKAEQAKRLTAYGEVFREAGGGERGAKMARGKALAGEYTKADAEMLGNHLHQEVKDALYNKIDKDKSLSEGQVATLHNTLGDLMDGKVPAGIGGKPSTQLVLLNKTLGGNITKNMIDAVNPKLSMKERAESILNIPRALMTTGEFSGVLRQALPGLVYKPSKAPGMVWEGFKAFASKKAHDKTVEGIKKLEYYNDFIEDGGDMISEMKKIAPGKSSSHEEGYQTQIAEKAPGIKRFERAYTLQLDWLRVHLYEALTNKAKKRGYYRTQEDAEVAFKDGLKVKKDKNGKPIADPKAFIDAAMEANSLSGRGRLGKNLEKVSGLMNAVWFSPRLIKSRIETFTNPFNPKIHRTIRREAFKVLFKMVGMGVTALSLAKAGGAEVEDDPRSSDFGKIKVGNTRYDIWGGHQQVVKTAAQLITGEYKTSGGIVKKFEEGFPPGSRLTPLARFGESKFAPTTSFLYDLAKGENWIGEPFDIKSEAGKRMVPMYYQDMVDAYKDSGIDSVLGVALPGLFGVGIQTYENPKVKARRLWKEKKMTKEEFAEFQRKEIIPTKPKEFKTWKKEAQYEQDIFEFSHLTSAQQIKFLESKTKAQQKRYLPYVNQNFWKVLKGGGVSKK